MDFGILTHFFTRIFLVPFCAELFCLLREPVCCVAGTLLEDFDGRPNVEHNLCFRRVRKCSIDRRDGEEMLVQRVEFAAIIKTKIKNMQESERERERVYMHLPVLA